ncbi:MAG: adenosylcobalamin-dependent ribonucleoside-diphosphate reductase [bacterium]|nr:adenosylcobalamin-dependent ribonucleoside-diphosphate reductase [bacterium]
MFSHVKKKDGDFESFHVDKLRNSIARAMKDAGQKDSSTKILHQVLHRFKKKQGISPHTEDIRKNVEDVLLEQKLHSVAKAYLFYTKKKNPEETLRHYFGKKHDLPLGKNAVTVLQRRYLRRDASGKTMESPEDMFRRVAKHIASAEQKKEQIKWEHEFYQVLSTLDFLPNTPCLVNAGTKLNLAGCYVLDVPDSLEGIYDALKVSALIFQSGAGVGYSFSQLRGEGSRIASTGRAASGPVSFMEIFDRSCETMKNGGIRRVASMGVLRIDHPDIFAFITEKAKGRLQNFNVSVAVTDEFMKAVIHNKEYWLRDHNGKKTHKLNAREVFDFLCGQAWECGDPGLLFIDEINRKHPMKKLGTIEATNTCGEEPLLANESCVLGSINLTHMVQGEKIDWPKLAKTVNIAVRFLDNVVSVNNYPTKDIQDMCLANRKIGLGIMGWADMLLALKIKYDSEKALQLAKEVMRFIRKHAEQSSEKLAKEKGVFINYSKSNINKKRRNATVLSIAPTGSISLIAGVSSGIEPLFALSYVREALGGVKLFESNKQLEEIARYRGFYSTGFMQAIAKNGSIHGMKNIPKDVQELFVTALDIPLEWHVKMQAVFQSEVDSAVSKTINLPNNATIGDVKRAYMLAWKEKCKGITVYRYGSKEKQVLYLGEHLQQEHTQVHGEYSGGCIGKDCYF